MSKEGRKTGTEILLEAMSKDKVHLARFILDALDGKIVDSKVEGGAQTPLITSILLPDDHARSTFMELLLKRGASVNCQGEQGRTALSYACEKGYLEAVQILIRNNADPEIVDTWGNTALMYATVAGHAPVVEFLVRAFKRLGLQIHRQNKVGNSAVELAKFLGHTDCFLALTSNSKRDRERELIGCARGSAWPQVTEFVSLKSLEQKLKDSKVCPPCEKPPAQEGAVLPTLNRRRSLMDSFRGRLRSMGSIEEFERENDSPSSLQEELEFSDGFKLDPKPPPRTIDHSPICWNPPIGVQKLLSSTSDQLPPLPSPGYSGAAASAPPNPLRILLTPILTHSSGNELVIPVGIQEMAGFKVRQFSDVYYQKRCSLPTTGIPSPTPPDRALMALRKSNSTVRRRGTSPTISAAPSTSPAPSALSALGTRLLRRFTFPECKPAGREPAAGACSSGAQSGGDSAPLSVRSSIPRSETYPQDTRHPQVGSKPSIDSISAVKCEFDFHFRTPPS